jgi:hypothetical protein
MHTAAAGRTRRAQFDIQGVSGSTGGVVAVGSAVRESGALLGAPLGDGDATGAAADARAGGSREGAMAASVGAVGTGLRENGVVPQATRAVVAPKRTTIDARMAER